MGWRCLICDTTTGQVVAPIDIPSLRWTLTVSDCSMSTERDKGTGDAGATGLQVPWSAVPATDAYGRSRMLASYRRAIVLVWEHGDGTASPVVFGAIGSRSDTWDDTSFNLVSPLALLGSRVLVREGTFGRGEYAADHTKGASGSAYGQTKGSWRAFLDWTRTEDATGVTVEAVGGIEVVSGRCDVSGVEVTVEVMGRTESQVTSISYEGTKKFGVIRMKGRMERGATRLSAKARCTVRHATGETASSGSTKYDTSTATSTAQVLTEEEYKARFKGVDRTSHAGATQGEVSFVGLSRRAIASAVGQACTDYKPGGALPIDWQYQGEAGAHSATYPGHDVANNTCKQIWTSLANSDGGPDIQLRPYMADESHVRLLMCAGSDSNPYLGQTSPVRTLTAFSGGGSARSLKVAYAAPAMRVYATGAGSDEAQLCSLAEDLSLCRDPYDPWPLVEEVKSFPDDESADDLAAHASARLRAVGTPMMQVQCSVHLGDPAGISPGDVWPGQLVDLVTEGFPSLPDGTYRMRLMQMDGDETDDCTLTFDVTADPAYA